MANDPYDSGLGGGVPTVTPETHLPDDYQHQQASPADFGAAIGTGLQQFGQGAVKATQFYSQVNAQDNMNRAQKEMDGALHGVPGQMVQQPDGSMAPDTGYLGKRGIDAANAKAAFDKSSQDIIEKYRNQVQTPEGQQDFDRWSQNYRSYVLRASGQHYETQFHAYAHSTNDEQAQTTLNAISNNAYSDSEFNTRLGDLTGAYTKKAQLDGLGNDGIAAAKQKALQDGWKARLETISVEHPDQAMALVTQHQKELGTAYEPLAQQFRARNDAAVGVGAAKDALDKAGKAASQGGGIAGQVDEPTRAFIAARTNEPPQGVSMVTQEFGGKLASAVRDAEAATGEQAHFTSLGRSTEEQKILHDKFLAGTGGRAAPPGSSRHEVGEAGDLSDGKVLQWLRTPIDDKGHTRASRYGLEFLPDNLNDPGHIQLDRAQAGPHYAMRDATHDFGGNVGGVAPGATGRGTINAAWTQPLEQKGAGGAVSPAEHFQFLKAQGASDNEALMLTGAAASESSFDPNATHDPHNGVPTGHGLYGHNDQRLDMRWQSWQNQARMALNELRSTPAGQMVNAAKSPEDLAIAQMHYERPRAFTPDNPQAGENYSGRLNTIKYFAQMTHGVFTGANGAPMKGGVASQPQNFGFGADKSVQMPGAVPLPPVDPAQIPPTPAPSAPPAPPVQEPLTPEQIKAAAYQAIRDRDDLNDVQKQHAYSAINQQITEQQVMEQATTKAKKEREEKQVDHYMTQIGLGQAGPDVVTQIYNDPALAGNGEMKYRLAKIAKEELGVKDNVGLGKGYEKLFQRIMPESQDRIADSTELIKAVESGELSPKGFARLHAYQADMRKDVKTQGVLQTFADMKKYAFDQVSFDGALSFPGMPPMKDQAGVDFYRGSLGPRLESEFDGLVEKGASAKDLYAWLRKENIDKIIADTPGRRSTAQFKLDRVNAGNDSMPKDAPIPAPPVGVDAREWTSIIKTPPVSDKGTPWPPANWAIAINNLRNDPSPAAIAAFNAVFESKGYKAEDILKKFPPGAAPGAAPVPAAPQARIDAMP